MLGIQQLLGLAEKEGLTDSNVKVESLADQSGVKTWVLVCNLERFASVGYLVGLQRVDLGLELLVPGLSALQGLSIVLQFPGTLHHVLQQGRKQSSK